MDSKHGGSDINDTRDEHQLAWWQLSLIGAGCTIGTGYFLGAGIGIKMTGPSIVLSYLLAAFGTYTVFHLLAKMTGQDPQKGSFCSYAKKAFGIWAGFSCGWTYWLSNILIMGSQLTAISLLTQYWFQDVPLWVFALGYAALSFIIVLSGTGGFDRIENIMAIAKIAAIFMFILIAGFALFGFLPRTIKPAENPFFSIQMLFPKGFQGFWTSLIYAFYAFGGIEVLGLMAMQLKKKEDAPKSGQLMLAGLTAIYIVSLKLAVIMVPFEFFNEKESPFVTALSDYQLPYFPHVFNGAMIIAGFSTMAASLFAVTSLLVTLAEEGDAPVFFAKKSSKKGFPLLSFSLAAAGVLASILAAVWIPESIYEYITTAAGILLLYNWFAIIMSALKLLTLSMAENVMVFSSFTLIIGSISGTFIEKNARPGFLASLLFVLLILFIAFKRKKPAN